MQSTRCGRKTGKRGGGSIASTLASIEKKSESADNNSAAIVASSSADMPQVGSRPYITPCPIVDSVGELAGGVLSKEAVAEVTTRCRKCNVEANPLDPRVRIFQEGSMVAQCEACGMRQVGLIRLFGTSNIRNFDGASEEDSSKFWSKMPSGYGMSPLETYIVNTPAERNYHRSIDAVVGKLLPLSWYAHHGFDISAIEAHTAEIDKEDHEVLGMTYRVKIHETRDTQMREKVREETHKYVEHLKKMQRLQRKAEEDSEQEGRNGNRSRNRIRKPKRHGKGKENALAENSMRDKLEKTLQEKLEKETQSLKDREEARATRTV